MSESRTIKILYNTVPGRIALKALTNPLVSRLSAHLLKSPVSRLYVPFFIKKNGIDTEKFIIPQGGYRSFNDFFTRRMKEKYRPEILGEFVAPCDGLLTISDINEESVFNIKHTSYSLKQLLKSEKLAKYYQGGTALIYRLTPAHYHRYIFAADGRYCGKKTIRGILHSVQPVCHEKTQVFIENSREYALIKNEKLGYLVQMEVGALLVGKISNHGISKGVEVFAGQEKGYFEYGGSTIVVLTRKKLEIAGEILEREKDGDEIPVYVGETIIK